MIVSVYCDESGTHDRAPLMILAGYVAKLGQWQRFDQKWSALLKRNGLTYHHTKEMMHGENEYKGWNLPKTQNFVERATKITEQNTLFGFTVRLKHSDYEEFYLAGHRPEKIQLDTKYGVCFRVCLSFLPLMVQRSLGRDDIGIHFILEAGGLGIGDTDRLFDLFKKQAPPELARLVSTRTVADKKAFFGLQAADSIAYSAYQLEQGAPDLRDMQPHWTVKEVRSVVESRSPVFRLDATPAVLQELKGNIVAQVEARKQIAQMRLQKASSTSSMERPAADESDASEEQSS